MHKLLLVSPAGFCTDIFKTNKTERQFPVCLKCAIITSRWHHNILNQSLQLPEKLENKVFIFAYKLFWWIEVGGEARVVGEEDCAVVRRSK